MMGVLASDGGLEYLGRAPPAAETSERTTTDWTGVKPPPPYFSPRPSLRSLS